MIRIDEIYNNVFLPKIQPRKNKSIHWFEPFGSTDMENLCASPLIDLAEKRYIFYDQEPIHLEQTSKFVKQFTEHFLDPTVLVTSEYNSEDVRWLCDTYNVSSAYYFFHGWAALDWYRGYNRTFLDQPKRIQHTFICPNNIVGGKRRHRLELFNELCKRDLVKSNLVSMPAVCPYEGITVKDQIECNIELPLSIDHFDNYANNSHQITMWKQAAESLVHVVTETSYYGNKKHLTEKIFKPVVLKQPFILASNRGSLEYLRRYGFKTFNSVWDESYDTLPDEERIVAIADLLKELEHADWDSIQKQCEPIVRHNYDWFYSGKFEQVLWNELLDMTQSW